MTTGGEMEPTCSRTRRASGAFIADSQFSGSVVVNGSRQQYLVKNSSVGFGPRQSRRSRTSIESRGLDHKPGTRSYSVAGPDSAAARPTTGGNALLAAVCARFSSDQPLSGLEVRDISEPTPPDGWEAIDVRAAALNHHDVWTLRGVGITEDELPVVLGTDAAGVTANGREVVMHAVLGSAGPGEDEMLTADFQLFSERGVQGTLAERIVAPSRNLVPKPASLSFAEAACLPTAYLTAYRMLFTRAPPPGPVRARAGGRRRRRNGGDPARERRWADGVRHEPERGEAGAGAGPRRTRGVRVGGAPA